MKVKQDKKVFTPVTIVLESQEELDLMSDLAELVIGTAVPSHLSEAFSNLCSGLSECGASLNYTYISGSMSSIQVAEVSDED